MPQFEIVTTAEREDLHDQFATAFKSSWPEFIFHDPVAHQFVSAVQERFARYDITVVSDNHVVAGGWGITLAWDQTVENLPGGYDDALVRALSQLDSSRHDTLSIMAIAVHPRYRGQGLSSLIISELRRRAESDDVPHVIAPVRPPLKSSYPLTRMVDFAQWRRGSGEHIDPWIRLHERMGAVILGPAERSMIITGSVDEWQSWTGMLFPQSGAYVVPEALDLVVFDCANDTGVYIEPNLWMRHC
ncbi:MAG: GNAT family N-acetyltransferase [Acidimicrobiaceae bacterium]|nr:GNAT family N-acetyltransferase [Acidimicrobiaceae bacterium]